jgi:hypothetical protein
LSAVDQHSFDVRGRGRPAVKRGVVPVAEFGTAVGVVQVDDDVGGIEQYNQVLREIGDCVATNPPASVMRPVQQR